MFSAQWDFGLDVIASFFGKISTNSAYIFLNPAKCKYLSVQTEQKLDILQLKSQQKPYLL